MQKQFYLLPFTLYLLTLIGCATLTPTTTPISPGMPGIYHRIEKGQTLWRISKIYDVDLNELVRLNRISDVSRIEVGQLIFIPYKNKQLHLAPTGSSEDFIWPMKGKVISSFGQTFNNMVNKGINILPLSSAEVAAARSGRVIFYADDFKGFGKTIIIDHGDGFLTVYSQALEVLVKPGDAVNKGMFIAKVNGYLHFEIRRGHIAQNPYFYLP